MGDKLSFIPLYERSPVFQLIISLLIVICGGLLMFSGLITAGSFIFHTDPGLIKDPSYAAGNNEVAFLKFALISQDISIFIIPSLIILYLLKPRYQTRISYFRTPALEEVFLAGPDIGKLEGTEYHDDADDGKPHGHFIGEHLCRCPKTP